VVEFSANNFTVGLGYVRNGTRYDQSYYESWLIDLQPCYE